MYVYIYIYTTPTYTTSTYTTPTYTYISTASYTYDTVVAAGKKLGLAAPVLYVYNRHSKKIEVEIIPTYLLVAMRDMYATRVRVWWCFYDVVVVVERWGGEMPRVYGMYNIVLVLQCTRIVLALVYTVMMISYHIHHHISHIIHHHVI